MGDYIMRDYDTVKEYIRKLKNKADDITEADLFDNYTLIIDAFNDYESEIDDSEKEQIWSLINSYIDKYEELEEIYDKLEYAATSHPIDYTSYIDFDEENPNPNDRSFIEEILERVHIRSDLRKHENEVHQILVETLGWYFNEIDSVEMLRSFLLKNAKDEILDEYAYQYGLLRVTGESDESLRYRILAHMKESYKVPEVKQSGIDLFTYVDNPYTQLTSKNTYLSRKYLAHGDETMMNYWDKKYITWRDIVWF